MFAMALQFSIMLRSLFMVPVAYFSIHTQYKDCMVEMSGGNNLLGVIVGISFPFLPFFVAKQAIMLAYDNLLGQGFKVRMAALDLRINPDNREIVVLCTTLFRNSFGNDRKFVLWSNFPMMTQNQRASFLAHTFPYLSPSTPRSPSRGSARSAGLSALCSSYHWL